ncbi:uncharacterized protein [Typha latifolia]|uniref:uncharacterized protein n=1 Tax=Typha latifolia TaxID=4733 RepID=UPI003C2AAD12
MGNLLSSRASVGTGGKVVLSDGTAREIDQPMSVAELMLEHPGQFVIDVHSLAAAKTRVAPLPADHKLEPEKVYVMLPMVRGKVSADEARRVLSTTRSLMRTRSMPSPAVTTSLFSCKRVKEDKKKDKKEIINVKVDQKVTWSTEVFEERPEFLSRQFSSKGWKPSLRTIEEKGLTPNKVPHWLF